MTPFVLMIGLGIHAIFEGLAVGISDKVTDILILGLAIFLHKGAAAMSLGISMTKTFPDNNKLVNIVIWSFAIFTPTGVGLGWIIGN